MFRGGLISEMGWYTRIFKEGIFEQSEEAREGALNNRLICILVRSFAESYHKLDEADRNKTLSIDEQNILA